MLKIITSSLLIILIVTSFVAVATEAFQLEQVLTDGVGGMDGLDNPRHIHLSQDNQFAIVTSADDNAVVFLRFDQNLRTDGMIKNAHTPEARLEGATGVMTFHGGKTAAVTSFYDSALSVYRRTAEGSYTLSNALSDDLGYDRVFEAPSPVGDLDKLGLLGAWGIALSDDEKSLFVASYQSNALSVLDIQGDGNLTLNRKYTADTADEEGLGGPVGVAYNGASDVVAVSGFGANQLTLFDRQNNGGLNVKQVIRNGQGGVEHLKGPQSVVFSEDGKYLFVACSGSHSIVVLRYDGTQYTVTQTVTHHQTGGAGLTGVASIAISPEGNTLYASGEFDRDLLVFDIADEPALSLRQKVQFKDAPIEGVTSIAPTRDGRHLMLTLGKRDAVYLLRIVQGPVPEDNQSP